MTPGPTVVITGGSAGVGRAAARAFAHKGFQVGLLARGVDRLQAAMREIEGFGGRCMAIPTDVADADAVEDAAAKIEAGLGPVEVWVNSAMTSVFSPVYQLEAEEVRRVAEVTYLGSVNGILAALRRMGPRNAGTIIQVGSALAYRAIPLQASYCASKFAIRGFVDSLRCELLHQKSDVRITTVHMPALNTPQFEWVRARLPNHPRPVPPIYQPEVAARAIVWAADHPRREYWIGYPTVGAIVANHLVPGLLDRYLARTNFEAQQTDQPLPTQRPDNLDDPVAGLQAAHGIFDTEAKSRSLLSRLSMHRRAVVGATSGVAIGLAIRRRS